MPTIRFYQHSETGRPYECAHKLKYDKDACVCVCVCACEKMPMGVWMYECIMCILISAIHHLSYLSWRSEAEGRNVGWRDEKQKMCWVPELIFFFFFLFLLSNGQNDSLFQYFPRWCPASKKRKECAEKSAFLFDIPKLPEWCHHVALCAISRS